MASEMVTGDSQDDSNLSPVIIFCRLPLMASVTALKEEIGPLNVMSLTPLC